MSIKLFSRLFLVPPLLWCWGLLQAQPNLDAPDAQVNVTTANDQTRPAAAQYGSGASVVAWESWGQDGDGYGIYGQLYDETGAVSLAEFQVNTDVVSEQRMPDVAASDAGNFVVAWMDDTQDGDGWGVYFQQFTSAGAATGSEQRFNSTTAGNQMMPKVGMDHSGTIYLTWMAENADGDGFAVMHRRYSSAGAALVGEVVVNDSTSGHQSQPDIAVDSAGNYVIVWQSENTDGDGQGVYAKVYDNTGTVLVSQFQVNTTTAGNQQAPSVGMDADGNFVISWSSYDSGNGVYQIYHRRYNAAGTALSGEVLTGTSTSVNQEHSDVAMTQEGQYAISWSSYGQDGSYEGVYLRTYMASGTSYGGEALVNSTTLNFQQHSGTAWRRDSTNLVLSWQSGFYNSTSTQDGDDYGIFINFAAVTDTTDPTAVCQNVTVYLDGAGAASIVATDVDGGSSDNVGIQSYSINNSNFACADVGNNTVILTVTDSAGNTASCNAAVTVVDSIAPTAVCQNITVYLDGTGTASITAADVDGGSTDNCSVSTTISSSSFSCSDAGTSSTILTASDGNGNSDTCTASVTVLDSVQPTAACQNLTVFLDGAGSATITAADLDNGSTDNCSLTLSASQSSFSCSDVGTVSVTLTATDPGGNTATCTSSVTIQDSVSPTALCMTTVPVSLNGSGTVSISTGDVAAITSDNCGISTSTVSPSSFTCSDLGNNTVTLTVTDVNGNSSSCTSVVDVADVSAPSAVCSNVTVFLDGTGNASVTTGDIDGGSTDNCSVSSLSLSQSSFTCADVGNVSVTLTATDPSANSNTCNATVSVVDSVSPNAVCQNLTVYLNGAGSASISTGDVDNGSSDNCSLSSTTLSQTSFACADLGSNSVTLTATDPSGNATTCTSTVTVTDSTSPSANCQDVTLYLNAGGNASLAVADVDNNSSDNCSVSASTVTPNSFNCSDAGTTTTVTLSLSDQSSNSDACNAQVTVLDTTAPTMVCQNITVFLDGAGSASITAADVDGGTTDNCSVSSTSINTSSFTCADFGNNNVTLTAVDASGVSNSCAATVFVEDTTSPAAVCQDLTLYLDNSGLVTVTATDVDNGSSDNCTIANSALSLFGFTCTDVGNNSVTLTVTDSRGNFGVCTSNILVVDSISPTAVCTTSTVYLDAAGSVTVSATDVDAGSTDNCSIALTTFTSQTYGCVDVGSTFSLPLTVIDPSGNSNACSAVITVADSTSPTMSCQNIVAYVDGTGDAFITTTDIDGGSADNCSIASLSLDSTSFDCSELGANTVTLTGLDASGNSSSCTGTVTLLDTISPVVACQNVTVYLDGNGQYTLTPNDISLGNTDNCGVSSAVLSTSTLTCSDIGQTTVTLFLSDASSNFASCQSTVTVEDSTSPAVACQAITAYIGAGGTVTVTAADIDNSSSDNCGIDSLGLTPVTYNCNDVGGPYALTLTAFDQAGNSSSCLGSVMVADTSAPVTSCQNVTLFLDATGNGSLQPSDVANTTDNCSVSEVITPSSFDCSNVGINSVSYVATDQGGLVDSCTATVFVADTTSPNIICQDVTVFLDATGTATITANDLDNGSNDNCGGVVLLLNSTTVTCADVGTSSVALLGQDVNSNFSSCLSQVTVADTFPPTAVCQPFTVYLDGTGTAFSSGADGDGGSTDNCGVDTTFLANSTFTCADIGVQSNTLTVVDVGGNTSSCAVSVTIEDSLSPVAVCATPTIYLDATGNVNLTVADVDGGSSDNCGIVSSSLNVTSFDCSDIGAQSVVMSLADSSGNTATCTANITIADSTGPVAVCQNVTVNLDANGQASLTASAVDGGSTDNCALASISISVDTFTCADLGLTPVVLQLADSNGNTSSCTAQVSVEDNIAPVANCTGTTVTLDANGMGMLSPADIEFGSTDNCGVDSLALSTSTYDCSNLGVNAVALTAFDAAGNADVCTANIFVQDTSSPTAVCANPTLYLGSNGTVPLTAADLDGGSSDNCGVNNLSFSPTMYSCSDVGTDQVVVTVTDQSGNNSTCTSTVTVEDTLSPMVVCVPDTVYLDSTGTASVTPSNVDGGSGDNCGLDLPSASVTPNSFTVADLGPNTVTLSISDVNGNVGSCQTTVTVLDTLADAIGEENLWVGQFDVWPNPTPGLFNVELSGVEGLMGEEVRFELTDMSGKVLLHELGKYGLDGLRREFDLSPYANGSYVLRVRVDGRLLTRKLVKY